jgi:Homeodomain-like domain
VFAVTVSPEVLEADLAAGRMGCPGCDGPLSPWGFGRVRELRMLHDVRSFRPRRACCHACQTTHVLMPAWSVPRRRDCAEVIGAALLAKAQGDGHRKIAARLGRPPATVRGWLRAFGRRADAVQSSALRWARAIDAQLEPPAAGSSFAGAVDGLGVAARACRLHLRTRAGPWELAVALTGGLLHGRPRDPPWL